MADNFDILLNGAPVSTPLVITSNAFTAAQLVLVHKNGAAGAGKLVQISTSCLMNINAVNGVLNSLGKFDLVVGPGFGAKGDASLTIKVGTKNKTLDIQFV